jgi:hypothetical protein
MSALIENRGTGGMGDGNPPIEHQIVSGMETDLPLYEFHLDNPGNPGFGNDSSYLYYGSTNIKYYRRGHGITIYQNKSILDAWWLSNKKIEPSKPIFYLGSYPKMVMFNYLLHTDTSNPNHSFMENKKVGYLLCDEYIAYGKFGEKTIELPFVEYPKPTNYVTHESGYLLRRSKLFRVFGNKYFSTTRGFFGTLLYISTLEGIFVDETKVKFGMFTIMNLDFDNLNHIQGFSYDLETSTEEQIGESYPVSSGMFYQAYLNFKEDKTKPVEGFDSFDNYCPEPNPYDIKIYEDESIQNKTYLSKRTSNDWSDDEETKCIRVWVKQKHFKN